MAKHILLYSEYLLESKKYWSKSKIQEYKRFIKYTYEKYCKEKKEMGFQFLPPFYKLITIGSYGTDKFREGESDIDFMLYVLKEVRKDEIIDIINYLNDALIDEYGMIEGKGGLIEVIGVNDTLWFE
jgi:predicted nucleotidyltransferase